MEMWKTLLGRGESRHDPRELTAIQVLEDELLSQKRALKGVIERTEALESKARTLELEWLETLDKVNKMMARTVQRAKALERAQEPAEEPQGNGSPPAGGPGTHSVLRTMRGRRGLLQG